MKEKLKCLKELEQKLDEFHTHFDAMRFTPNSAIPEIFQFADIKATQAMLEGFQNGQQFLVHEQQRAWYDGLDQAVRWLHGSRGVLEFDKSMTHGDWLYKFLWHASDYANLADLHWDAYNGLCDVECDRDSRTARFFYSNEQDDLRSLRTSLASFQEKNRNVDGGQTNRPSNSVITWLNGSLEFDGTAFSCTDGEDAKEAVEYFHQLQPTTLPGDWQVADEYTLNEARYVLTALQLLAGRFQKLVSQAVSTQTPNLFPSIFGYAGIIDFLVKATDFRREKIESIVTDLSYGAGSIINPTLWLQPLFPLEDERMLLQCGMLMLSSHERNITSLISKLPGRRGNYEQLKNNKEALFTEEISELLGSFGWEFETNISVPGIDGGSGTDIDLLAWNGEDECAVLELKWPIPADAIKEIIAADKELEKGCKQIRKAIAWFKRDPKAVISATRGKISESNLQSAVGFVLSRTSFPSHRLHTDDVAIGTWGQVRDYCKQRESILAHELFESIKAGPRPEQTEVDEGAPEFHEVKVGELTYICPSIEPA